MMFRKSLPLLGLALAVLLAGGSAQAQGKQERAESAILAAVAQQYKLPVERLHLGDHFSQTFPYSGQRLDVATIWDSATGQSYESSIDASGRQTTLAEAEVNEAQARTERVGKLSSTLAAQLAQAGAKDALAVSIWLNVPDLPLARGNIGGADAAAAQAADTATKQRLAAVEHYMNLRRQDLVATLRSMGVEPHQPRFGPVLFASLTRAQIDALAKRDDIAAFYAQSQYALFQDDAGTTERVNPVWDAGNFGQLNPVRPVVHESDGISDLNPYLNNATHPVIFYNSVSKMNTGPFPNNHATNVAGIIASTHPLIRGLAPNVQLLLSANAQTFDDADLVDAFEWGRGNGGNPTNMSWGTKCGGDQNFWSRYADWAVRNLTATIVASAGNTGYASLCGSTTEDQKVSSPGLAWSVITVGSIDDGASGFWNGDAMSSFSRWINPDFATGMEKPEVVAVGDNVVTTDNAGGTWLTSSAGVDGTSFSAPQVSGQVALMLSRRPGQTEWPETNKAAVLASAFHDISGGLADKSKDGVGAIVINNSDDTYRLGRYINYSWPPTYTAALFSDKIALTAGQVARVAMAWDAQSNGSSSDVLGADLNMCVRRPDNTNLACSNSAQNAWELVEFTVPTTGNYDVVVTRGTTSSGWPGTYLGIAWATQTVTTPCANVITVPSAGGTISGVSTATGPTFWDSYAGWSFLQNGRERLLRITTTATKDIRVTDTNANLDLHVVQIFSCAGNPFTPTIRAQGADLAVVDNAAAGAYYIIVDGRNGAVGTTNVTVTLSGP